MNRYAGREAVKTLVRDVVRPGTFDGDCGIIAYAILVGTTYGTALYAARDAGFVKGEGIGADVLAEIIHDALGEQADSQLHPVAGSNLQTFLADRPDFTGLVIIAGSTGHAVPVVNGFAYNVDSIHAMLPLIAAQEVRK